MPRSPAECDEATPAAFYAGPSGMAIGAAALRLLYDAAARHDVRNRIARDIGKRSLYHIGGRDYTPAQVASLVLKDLREVMEQKAGGHFALPPRLPIRSGLTRWRRPRCEMLPSTPAWGM